MTFALQRTLFGVLTTVYNRVGDREEISYKNFDLRKPCSHVMVT